jgi:signal transduction histidine kinase
LSPHSKSQPRNGSQQPAERSVFFTHANGAAAPSTTETHGASEAVLIISDEAEFSRSVLSRWQMERHVPAFTLMGSELCNGGVVAAAQHLAILGPRVQRRSAVLETLENAETPIICVAAEGEAAALRAAYPRLLLLLQSDGWLDQLLQLAGEVLRRTDASRRMQQAEQLVYRQQRHATLGRYMLEMRHGLNNCLTSVLGNAELLLLEPGLFNAQAREQLETIHTMALRMHEVLQRFSSLESEMQFAEKESHSETPSVSQAYVRST